jgi:DNA-binding FadR family transcriptional regulator
MDGVISSLTLASRLHNGTTAHIDETRLLLEVPIAGLSAERATPGDIEKMEAALEIMDRTIENLQDPDNLQEFIRADLDFHSALAAATQNPFILILSNSVVDILHQDRLLKKQPALRRSRLVAAGGHEYHRQILECIRRRDPDGARIAMRKHLQYHATVKRQKDDPSQLSESLTALAAGPTDQETGD